MFSSIIKNILIKMVTESFQTLFYSHNTIVFAGIRRRGSTTGSATVRQLLLSYGGADELSSREL
jgi:hypothetical protein